MQYTRTRGIWIKFEKNEICINNCEDLPQQLDKIPKDITHLFISIGGNDVLMHIDSFAESVSNIGEAFDSFNERMEDFEKNICKDAHQC